MRQKISDPNNYDEELNKADDDHGSSSRFPLFFRSFSTSAAVDISAQNNVTMDVLDIKTMLLKIKKLLEQV